MPLLDVFDTGTDIDVANVDVEVVGTVIGRICCACPREIVGVISDDLIILLFETVEFDDVGSDLFEENVNVEMI